MSDPYTPPFPWPKPAWLRRGAGKRLLGIWVVHDFDWFKRFKHDRAMFRGSGSIALHVKKWTTDGKGSVLFLTDRDDIDTPTVEHSEKLTFVIWSVEKIQTTAVDLATSAIGKAAADSPNTLQAYRKIQKSPEALKRLIQEELTVEQIAEWATLDPKRADALVELVAALEGIAPARTISMALDLLAGLATDKGALEEYSQRAERPTLNLAAAAATYARQFLALQEFRELIARHEKELSYQKFLEEHHWMFGTRYVERWTGRQINVGNQQDFIMRSADGYYDVIEIKRPEHVVMAWDSKHKNFYPSVDLSQAVGQVQKYLEDMDHELPAIEKRAGLQLHRAHATIVIGDLTLTNLDAQDPRRRALLKGQRAALRGYNSHLSRITILTYDDVLAMAQAIHGYTQGVIEQVIQGEQAAMTAKGTEDEEQDDEGEDGPQGEDEDETQGEDQRAPAVSNHEEFLDLGDQHEDGKDARE